MIKNYVKLFRVKHYIKNILIFFPLAFGKKLFDPQSVVYTIAGFFAFSFLASIIYIINDMNDIEADRQHPKKRERPLASGAISFLQAKISIVILIVAIIFINYKICGTSWNAWLILLVYWVSNYIYSAGGKHIALLDVAILVLGYVLRVYYGALIIDTSVSSWLYITVLSMAFFLGFGKRRNELKMQGVYSRKVLKEYPINFLDRIMYLCLGLTITFYSLWCESFSTLNNNQFMLFTIPLMMLICFRYCMDIEGESDGDPVEVVMSDISLIIMSLLYGMMVLVILYIV